MLCDPRNVPVTPKAYLLQSWASWAKMTNQTERWTQSQKLYRKAMYASAEAEAVWWIDTTLMVERGWWLPWELNEILESWIEESCSRYGTKAESCSLTCAENDWRAYGDCSYHSVYISNATWDISTRIYLYQSRFWKTTVTRMHRKSPTQCGTKFVTC